MNWQAYMEESRTFRTIVFQVWRSLSECNFELVGSHTIQNYPVGSDYLVNTSILSSSLTPIVVQPGYIAAVFVDSGVNSVGIQHYPDDMTGVFQRRLRFNFLNRLTQIDYCGGDMIIGSPIMTAEVIQGRYS